MQYSVDAVFKIHQNECERLVPEIAIGKSVSPDLQQNYRTNSLLDQVQYQSTND